MEIRSSPVRCNAERSLRYVYTTPYVHVLLVIYPISSKLSQSYSRLLHELVPLINIQKLHFKGFCKNCRSQILEILYDTKTCNFTSGEANCTSKICKFFQCACANLCSIKWRNSNSEKLKFWLWLIWTVFYLKQTRFI